uniref:Secreted protein n=1 Tax=Plectus sambesii TaxID=2011161 RepID=A0A914V0G3_9BILA
MVALKRAVGLKVVLQTAVYLELVYLVTALVPSDTACLASSPGRMSRTAVCTSRLEMVLFLLYWARRDASAAMRSKMSFTCETEDTGEPIPSGGESVLGARIYAIAS